MFTGLVETTGEVVWLRAREKGSTQLLISAPGISKQMRVGDSLAANGCCLTATSIQQGHIAFDLLEETLACTNLGMLRPGMRVNLERPLAANSRLGGHFVQGHVDCACGVVSLTPSGADHRLEVALPTDFSHLTAYKGSIAVNGVSLTVAEVLERSFVCWLIPHTFEVTNLGTLVPGDKVNVEFDILAKYVERILPFRKPF